MGDAEGDCVADVLCEGDTAAVGDGTTVGAVFDGGTVGLLGARLATGLGLGLAVG